MPKLPFFDIDERRRIRDALNAYKKRHGDIGDPKLCAQMEYVLDPQDLGFFSQSTLQRFIANKGRTDDEAIRRFVKFLKRAAPQGRAGEAASAMASGIVLPVYPRPRDVTEYQGRYESYGRPGAGALPGSAFGEPNPASYIMFPSPDPRVMTVWGFEQKTGEAFTASAAFLRIGIFEFLLMSLGVMGTSWFALLSETGDDPLTLQGTLIQTADSLPPGEPAYEIRLVRTAGPKLKPRDEIDISEALARATSADE